METKTAAFLSAAPPCGHVFAGGKWRSSPLCQSLRGGGVSVVFEAELGAADFHLPDRRCILYVSECDIISGSGYKKKLVRFRASLPSSQQDLVLVLVEKTPLSEQNFSGVQRLVVFNLGLTLVPVGGQTEAAQLITCMVFWEGGSNPFRRVSCSRPSDPLVLALVQQIPGVGRVKALALLQNFPSIQQLCAASPAQLEPAVGPAAAQLVHSFFHKPA